MSERKFCLHCRSHQPAAAFAPVHDKKTGRLINYKCARCIELGKKPKVARDTYGKQRAEERRSKAHRLQRDLEIGAKEAALQKARETKGEYGGHCATSASIGRPGKVKEMK